MFARRVSLLLCTSLVLGFAVGGSLGTASTEPAATTAQVPACVAAQTAERKAQTALTKAQRALKKARTTAAKKRARARVAKARKAYRAARSARQRICAASPTTPTTPTTPVTPTMPGTPTTPVTPPTTPTTPTTPPPSANQPPAFPNPVSASTQTNFTYDPGTGRFTGATTTISVTTPPTDPDGDPLTYSWTVTNGTIEGNGLSATWTRVISFGSPADGTATITVSDGRGGTDSHAFVFN